MTMEYVEWQTDATSQQYAQFIHCLQGTSDETLLCWAYQVMRMNLVYILCGALHTGRGVHEVWLATIIAKFSVLLLDIALPQLRSMKRFTSSKI
jgi:hypothetical protein